MNVSDGFDNAEPVTPYDHRLTLCIEELGGKVEALTNAVMSLYKVVDDLTVMVRMQSSIALDARQDALKARRELETAREAFDEERRAWRRDRPTDPDMMRGQ